MKLIFISSLVPVAQPKSGFDIANRIVAEAIIRLGVDLQIIGFIAPGAQPAFPNHTNILGELEVTNAKVGTAQKLKWLMRSVLTGLPLSAVKMHAASTDQVRTALEQVGPADGYVLNSLQLSAAFEDLFSDKNSIYISHNVEWQSAVRNANLADKRFVRFLFQRDAGLLRDVEERLCNKAKHVFCFADQDRADLSVINKSSTLPLLTRPDYLDIAYQAPAPVETPNDNKPSGNRCDLGLIGSWSWAANRHGLDWFLAQIVPKLPEDVSICVAGLIDQVPDHCPPNVKFVGQVPCADAFIKNCRVIPLISQEGTGVQLKSLETFEFGLPSVATRSAVRAIADVPANCMLADSDEAYANALITLVRKSRAGEDLTENGSSFIQRQRQNLMQCLSKGLQAAGFELPKGQDAA